MKKVVVLVLAIVMVGVVFAGCSKDEAAAEIEKFEGKVSTLWTDVKDEFTELEEKAVTEVEDIEKVETKEVKKLVAVIETNYEKIKEGVTEDTHKYAKEMYEAGHKLEAMGEKYADAAGHDIVKLGADAKAYVKHLYGEAEVDYSKVKTNVEKGLEGVKNYSKEEWNKIVDLFA